MNIEKEKFKTDIIQNSDITNSFANLKFRLHNGEIKEHQFNFSNKLQEVYIHVKNISNTDKDFKLYEGFPPKHLEQMDKTIKELNLKDTIIIQKIS